LSPFLVQIDAVALTLYFFPIPLISYEGTVWTARNMGEEA
jgi:hypothetical protein